MTLLSDMGLTPAQANEIENANQDLVEAWLAAVANARGLKSPVGFFLHGIRSGEYPSAVSDRRVQQARRLMLNVRSAIPDEREALEMVFGDQGLLQGRGDEPELRAEFVRLWEQREHG